MDKVILTKNIDSAIFMWRYMDIHKLLSFIYSKSIAFSRMDMFSDKLEGVTSKYWETKWILDKLPDPVADFDLEMPNPTRDTRQKLLMDEMQILDSYQKSSFVSCWFLGNRESVAMWNLYSNPDSVAIKINAQQLIRTVITSTENHSQEMKLQRLIAGKVKYRNIIGYNPVEQQIKAILGQKGGDIDVRFKALRKDDSYKHENEFRFILEVSEASGTPVMLIPIDKFNLLQIEIVFHPRMQEWQKENIKAVLRNQEKYYNLINSEVASWLR